jgi:hypothetical protein
MDSSVWFGFVMPVLIVLAVASRGFRVDEEYMSRWASSAGIELTEATRPAVRRYLMWSRRLRTMGGLIGFLAPVIYVQVVEGFNAVPDSDTGGTSVMLMFAGYLVGALVAELAINRPRRSSGSVVPGGRRLGDYLSRYLMITQRALGILCAVLVAAYVLLAPLAGTPDPQPGLVAIFGSAGVGVALVVEGFQRLIIGRHRSATTAEELAVDDAMRSSSLHVVAGAGVALLIFFITILITGLLTIVDTPQGLVSFALMLFLFPLSIFFWLDSSKPHGFRVRRGRNGQVAV